VLLLVLKKKSALDILSRLIHTLHQEPAVWCQYSAALKQIGARRNMSSCNGNLTAAIRYVTH
jgi:hypothetical protein